MNICPLCGRDIPPEHESKHHLVPKTFKGKDLVILHKVCHKKLHSAITEREMLHHYNTIERLKSHPEIEKFIKWVRKRPIDYNDSSRLSKNVRKRRR